MCNSSLPLKEELSHPCFLPSIPARRCMIWSLFCKHRSHQCRTAAALLHKKRQLTCCEKIAGKCTLCTLRHSSILDHSWGAEQWRQSSLWIETHARDHRALENTTIAWQLLQNSSDHQRFLGPVSNWEECKKNLPVTMVVWNSETACL